MRVIALATTTLLVALKDIAYGWSLVTFCFKGGSFADELRAGRGVAIKHDMPAQMNPIDRGLKAIAERTGKTRAGGRWLRFAFRAPPLIVVATLIEFAIGGHDPTGLSLALGIAIALCSLLVLLTALMRRLILGPYDWLTSDVQVTLFSASAPTSKEPSNLNSWAVRRTPGANNTVYFLAMLALSSIGFAALYFALSTADPRSFSEGGASAVTWVYFSVTTVSTVGSSISALSHAARIAVICQVATGPLLLSWLLTVFLGQGSPDSESERESSQTDST